MYHGAKDATTNPARITGWWGAHPSANIGIATGEASGLFVVGPDGQAGIDALTDLERRYGALPATPTARTGGGGCHRYYRWPASGGITNRQDHEGLPIDVRGEGGYAVAPPSQNGAGPYTWELAPDAIEVAEAPPWFLDWIRSGNLPEACGTVLTVQPDTEARAVAYLAKCPSAISGQGGHDQTFEVARAIVFGFDLGPEVGYRLLADHYNPHCAPPWNETELRHKCKEADCKPYDKPRGYLLHTPHPDLVFGANGPQALSRRTIEVETVCHVGGLATTCLAGMSPQPVKWLVPEILPRGKLALVAGDGGWGKSVLTLALSAAVSNGRAAFGLAYDPPPPSDVLLISCEDDFNDTVVPRLIALEADLNRCHRVDGSIGADGKVAPFSLAHFHAIGQELQRRKEVRLIVIDPAGAYIGNSGIDDHKDAQLRALLGPLAEVAASHDVCIVLVKHLNRNTAAKAVNRVMGSAGYVNTVRAAFLVAPDVANDRRLVLPMKANLTSSRKGFAFRPVALPEGKAIEALARFHNLEVEDRDRLAKQLFCLEWLGSIEADPDEVLVESARKERGPTRVQECADWLAEYLKNGPRPSKDIDMTGRSKGFTIDNINKAKAALKEKGLQSSNRGQFRGKWWSGFGEPESWVLKFPMHKTHENHENHEDASPGQESRAHSCGPLSSPEENRENPENHEHCERSDKETACGHDSHDSHGSCDRPEGGHETGPQVDRGLDSTADLIRKVTDDPTSPLRPDEEEVQL
jgi:hypothetical protein